MKLWRAFLLLVLALPAWAESGGHEAKSAEGGGHGGSKEGVSSTIAVTPTVLLPNNERVFSPAEVALLTDLDAKKVELERRTQALELREKLADLMERRLAEKTKELQTLKTQIEDLMTGLSGKDDKDLAQLAQMYAAMKPTAAASVLNKLDNKIVHDVLMRMAVKKSGKILEVLDPVKARVVSEMMAARQVAGDTAAPVTP